MQVSKPDRIPSLDGLRALSILGVLVSHAVSPWYESHRVAGLGALLTYGNLGVRVFFAVSGFLITTLLLREEKATGTIDLAAFYVRRSFRILPTYWTFLVVIFVFGPALPVKAYLTSWAFLSNYLAVPWPLGHSWSLSVEEQFYLLWPTMVLLLGPRGRLTAVIILWLTAPICRLFLPLPWGNEEGIQNNLDSLMAGCFLSIQAPRLQAGAFRGFGRARATLVSALLLLVVSPIVASFSLRHAPSFRYFAVAKFVESIAIANVIWFCVSAPESVLGRILNARPLVHFGVISYCLYIWQQPLLLRALNGASWPRTLLHFGAVILLAELCHRWVEVPAIKVGRRLQRRRLTPPLELGKKAASE